MLKRFHQVFCLSVFSFCFLSFPFAVLFGTRVVTICLSVDERVLLLIPFFAKATFPSDLELQQYGACLSMALFPLSLFFLRFPVNTLSSRKKGIHVQRVTQASGMVVMGRGVTAHKVTEEILFFFFFCFQG